jgi:hypothetical protein
MTTPYQPCVTSSELAVARTTPQDGHTTLCPLFPRRRSLPVGYFALRYRVSCYLIEPGPRAKRSYRRKRWVRWEPKEQQKEVSGQCFSSSYPRLNQIAQKAINIVLLECVSRRLLQAVIVILACFDGALYTWGRRLLHCRPLNEVEDSLLGTELRLRLDPVCSLARSSLLRRIPSYGVANHIVSM